MDWFSINLSQEDAHKLNIMLYVAKIYCEANFLLNFVSKKRKSRFLIKRWFFISQYLNKKFLKENTVVWEKNISQVPLYLVGLKKNENENENILYM